MSAIDFSSDVRELRPQTRSNGRLFGWLLGLALASGPLASLVNWAAAYAITISGCETSGPLVTQFISQTGSDLAGVVLIALGLGITGILSAVSAWRTLRMQSRGRTLQSLAATLRPPWFLAVCAVAGSVLFVIAVILNGIALAVVPACM
jgi:hypothetical protein